MNETALTPSASTDPTRDRLQARLRAARQNLRSSSSISRRDPAQPAELSFAEEQLWFLDQFLGGTPTYNINKAYRLRGRLDLGALRRSADQLVQRHESLRTIVNPQGPVRRILPPTTEAAWQMIDRPGVPESQRPAEAARLIQEHARQPSDLLNGPLARFQVIRFADDDHVFGVTIHHIISDGWSAGIMFRELGTLYRAEAQRVRVNLPEVTLHYGDFAVWQRRQAAAGAFDHHLEYWSRQLEGAPGVLELPTDHPRPAAPSFRGVVADGRLSLDLRQRLEEFARAENTSLLAVLLAVFNVLLTRCSEQTDLVVGSPFASRTLPVLDQIVGYFANMLPLRTRVDEDASFRALVGQVRQTVLEAMDHQDVPFAKIVERVSPIRHSGTNPVFQVALVLQEQGLVAEPDFGGLELQSLDVSTGTAKFDVSLLMVEAEDGIDVRVECSADLFDHVTAERILRHFRQLASSLVSAPDEPVSRAEMMTTEERRVILREWRGAPTNFPREASVTTLFEEQARRRPHSPALVWGGSEMSYSELNRRANHLAHKLRELGAKPGTFVAVGADRSPEFVVAILAILKSGAAYVPLDPRHPATWLAQMLRDTNPVVFVVTPALRSAFPPTDATVLPLDQALWQAALHDREEPDQVTHPPSSSTAYVMFTSGSTGRPKGTIVSHRAIVRLVRNTNYVTFSPNDVFALLSNLAFDASTFEIWGALLNGARLAIPETSQPSLAQIGEVLRRHHVTTLFLTTGLFNLIVDERIDDLASVRQLLTGGEVMSTVHIAKALAALPETQLANIYGPTENTVFSTWYPVGRTDVHARAIPIGRPIANTTAYILDRRMRPVPVGVPGELYTGGDGLADGYLQQPELTAEKFVPDPFDPSAAARLYRTGDLCKWREDGTIEFIGRIDQEIKVRGYRVDLADVEAALTNCPGVATAAAIVRTSADGAKEIRAFVVPAGNASLMPAQVQQQLAAQLPGHMVPASITVVPALPLTANGKIDRRMLASLIEDETAEPGEIVSPRSETERKLLAIWQTLLRRDRISVRDNFFDLGGHSLLAMRLLHRVHEEFGDTLPLATVLSAPTIEALAARLDADRVEAGTARPALRGHGPGTPLFFIPGLGGVEFLPTPVAQALEGVCPYYDTLQMIGVDRRVTPSQDVREIAADLVRQIRAVQPRGPYNICGYCYGGVVAYEVARQLEEAGEKIPALIIWHGSPDRLRTRTALEVLAAFWERFRAATPRQRSRVFLKQIPLAFRTLRWKLLDLSDRMRGRPRRRIPRNVFFPDEMDPRLVYANLHARATYSPAPYRGRVFLLFGDTDRLLYECPPLAGWDGLLLGPVEIFKHPVEHMEMIVPPAVNYLAAQTAACVTAAENGTRAKAVPGFTAVPSVAARVPRRG